MSLTDNRNKIKHIRALQRLYPYETPINVKQVSDLRYCEDLCFDYYQPMAYRLNEAAVHFRSVLIVLPDEPFLADKGEAALFAMDMAKRGFTVFVPNLCRGKGELFYAQLNNLFLFLSALSEDKIGLGVTLRTPQAQGSVPVMVGLGSGALLGGVCLQLYGNYAARAHFAAHCPAIADYFAMGETPDVDLSVLPAFGGFVSVCGLLHLPLSPARRDYAAWFGVESRDKLYDWLQFASNAYLGMPPMLLTTVEGDSCDKQAALVADAMREASLDCRVVRSPAKDENKLESEPLFNVYYPMWRLAREVNDQIASFCKGLERVVATN